MFNIKSYRWIELFLKHYHALKLSLARRLCYKCFRKFPSKSTLQKQSFFESTAYTLEILNNKMSISYSIDCYIK